MGISKASAKWDGNIKTGKGVMSPAHGGDIPFSLGSRFEGQPGSNPEELLGAALSGCFSMALSLSLEKAGSPQERTNHYANFHFLRGKDNLNKSDIPPHEWFKKPGDQPSYTDADLAGRLLSWDLLQPGGFDQLITTRGTQIQDRALALFGTDAPTFDKLFAEPNVAASAQS